MAFYSDGLVDEILASTDIVEVINEYVPLKRRGANYLGLCPFHKEKTPSFTVSPDKQIYKCFGCGQGGSVIQFISKLENLDFRETLETLAERAHIDLKRYEVNSQYNDINRDLRDTIIEINKSSARYFYDALLEQVKMEKSQLKDYLVKRRLDMKTVTRFGLGFGSKKEETLLSYLNRLGYKNKDILASGVVSKTMKGDIYEAFAGRLIFPIMDTRDRVIGFGGRVLDKSLPKYVNSPENALYHKGSNLYGLNVAKKEALQSVIIVEGYMDAVALHKSGIMNAVASLGTALTEKQAKLLKKYTDTVIISYDQDTAGQAATLRGIDILYKEGLKIKVLKLDHTDVKDPDEYINKYGREKFQECVESSMSHIAYKISKLEGLLDKNSFDSKVEFLSKTANILAMLENDIEREMYCQDIAKKYNISKDALTSEINKKLRKEEKQIVSQRVKGKIAEKKERGPLTLRKKQEEYILGLLFLKDKLLIEKVFNRFDSKDFMYDELAKLYDYLKTLHETYDLSKINILTKVTNDSEYLELVTEILAINLSSFDKQKLYQDLDIAFKKYSYVKRREELLKRLSEDIQKDEKEMLEVELGQIILKLAKMK